MELSLLNIIATIVTYLVFGSIGYRLSRKFKRPVRITTWIGTILGTLLVGYVLPGDHSYLISGFGFNVFVSMAFSAIGVGVVVGLAIRELKLKFDDPTSQQQ